jgi:hypothetical protein
MSSRPGSPACPALQAATLRCLLSRNFAEYAAAWAEVRRLRDAGRQDEPHARDFDARRAA